MLREILSRFEDLVVIKEPVKKELEITRYLLKYPDRPVLFEDVEGWKVAGNIWSTRKRIATYLNTTREELIHLIAEAMENPRQYKEVKEAPFLKNSTKDFSLKKLPIPKYYPRDGGQYFTSAMVIAKDDNGFVNVSFHRMMVRDEKTAAIRLVPRHLYAMWKEKAENGEDLDVRIVVGNPVHLLLAGSVSTAYGVSELEIASAMSEIAFGKPLEVIELGGIPVPIESEFVFEARITPELVDEGPFVDITGTYDIVRRQPLVVFEKMYHVDDPIFHALLSGGYEHYMLMGLPKEPQIYASVKRVVPKVHGVRLTEGGAMWLHAVVSITKQHDGDGKNAILAAFAGHPSLKRVIVVDEDINIYDDREVEWAVATRFQPDRDLVIVPNARGSSLDPSAEKGLTAKWGIDATKPLGRKEEFERARV
ncbi:3-octaprenyl-4-hydroxybenzoate decarboxylyase [Thermococcus kodakarensis KOD1]|uniref:Anhydromevalonate phosphate decarboxylase n=1 Tax=Thermococcus kodakarensis (strain ATCC BAA-918 / JCM 12380 / KOD1) TaxID=69014 RepID=Q5JI90_THEKO|nr:UbiD family decarboxylase [Thermococcus kodakarensis]WCN28914.1 UbiD family decarboxylase [Thermococcus kodakarensis]WCN31216.1 UbiD family decarboxylase [Thermococcus kodakarensis]BAD85118.1 3-octaprenyl-4-hydroxybenzoate decarboxylyase [Thermococcus kodakarensis KOD1]